MHFPFLCRFCHMKLITDWRPEDVEKSMSAKPGTEEHE